MQQPDTQKNLLIAIILSIAVLLGWQMFFGTPQPQREQAAPPAPTEGVPSPGAAPDATAPMAPGTAAPSAPAVAPTREAALAASPRVAIDTPSVRGSIALKGGRIDDLVLKRYRETVQRLLCRVRVGCTRWCERGSAGPRHPLAGGAAWAADDCKTGHAGLGQPAGPGLPPHLIRR